MPWLTIEETKLKLFSTFAAAESELRKVEMAVATSFSAKWKEYRVSRRRLSCVVCSFLFPTKQIWTLWDLPVNQGCGIVHSVKTALSRSCRYHHHHINSGERKNLSCSRRRWRFLLSSSCTGGFSQIAWKLVNNDLNGSLWLTNHCTTYTPGFPSREATQEVQETLLLALVDSSDESSWLYRSHFCVSSFPPGSR